MPPKKGAKGGKKGGGGGDEAGRLFREPLPEKEPLADVPPLSRAAVRPLPLLPLWQDPAEIGASAVPCRAVPRCVTGTQAWLHRHSRAGAAGAHGALCCDSSSQREAAAASGPLSLWCARTPRRCGDGLTDRRVCDVLACLFLAHCVADHCRGIFVGWRGWRGVCGRRWPADAARLPWQ